MNVYGRSHVPGSQYNLPIGKDTVVLTIPKGGEVAEVTVKRGELIYTKDGNTEPTLTAGNRAFPGDTMYLNFHEGT